MSHQSQEWFRAVPGCSDPGTTLKPQDINVYKVWVRGSGHSRLRVGGHHGKPHMPGTAEPPIVDVDSICLRGGSDPGTIWNRPEPRRPCAD